MGWDLGLLAPRPVSFSCGAPVPGAFFSSFCENVADSCGTWKTPWSFLPLMQAHSPMPTLGSQKEEVSYRTLAMEKVSETSRALGVAGLLELNLSLVFPGKLA